MAEVSPLPTNFDGGRYFPLGVLWLPGPPAIEKPLPAAAVYGGEQAVAIFRTGWDANATWFAIKGGTPAANHGHMDVGSFVYDAHGVRWIHDFGSENYNLPGYFGSKRWSYFRLQNRSHNTLEINGKLQNAEAEPCQLVSSSPLAATFDFSNAYAGAAKKVLRGASFDARTGVVRIEDQITEPTGQIVWRAFTDAAAEIQGDRVILKKDGHQITLHRTSGTGTWSITDAIPPTPAENQNSGFSAVVLTIPQADQVSASVEIRP